MTLDPKALEAVCRYSWDETADLIHTPTWDEFVRSGAEDEAIASQAADFREVIQAAITAYLAALPPVDVADLADRVASHWDEEGITAPVPVDVAELVGRMTRAKNRCLTRDANGDPAWLHNPFWPAHYVEAIKALTRLARERDALRDSIETAIQHLNDPQGQRPNNASYHLRSALSATKADTRAETSDSEMGEN